MGFTQETFEFLRLLAANNERAWFAEHKLDYEQKVREPALAFVEQMQPLLHDISPRLLVSAKKSGGSMMRVFKDTRFSHDKTPYKTNIGIQFRHFMGKDVHAPGLYLHIDNEQCFLAAGMWQPDNQTLNKFRHFIDENPRSWCKVRDDSTFRRHFNFDGSSLKRPPRGFDKEHPLLEDLKRKDLIAVMPIERAQVLQPDFDAYCAEHFSMASPYMQYLCMALDLPW